MQTCWIFAHPDDEAFGPGLAMARLARAGHGVHLFTLTRGGASRLRAELGVDRAELERLRSAELADAAAVLGCASLQVGDWPDGALASCDRVALAEAVLGHLQAHRPRLVVTLPPHGINGHPDHCVTSAVVAQAWWQYRRVADHRSTLLTVQLARAVAEAWGQGNHGIDPAAAAVRMRIDPALRALGKRALDCHVSQRAVIEEHRPLDRLGDRLLFSRLGTHDPESDMATKHRQVEN